MIAPCYCPATPDLSEVQTLEELEKITGGPIRCVCCGGELELRCPEGHVHLAPPSKDPNRRPIVKPPKLKRCPGCGEDVAPRRFQRRCDRCTPVKVTERRCEGCGAELTRLQRRCYVCHPKPGPTSNRVYPPKQCACGATFTPTGPRAVRCPNCRGTTV